MELSFTTFVLEIVNFLILVWILKRLFFAPVKNAIEVRRLDIKKSLDNAENTKAEASKLRLQYEDRLKDWEREKNIKVEELKKELELLRQKRLEAIGVDEKKERDRLQAQEEKERKEIKERQEREAISQSLTFLSKFLMAFSSKEVESSIIRIFNKKIEQESELSKIQNQSIIIRSAFPLLEIERTELLKEFEDSQVKFEVDPGLIAGLEIVLGASVLRANLRDELTYFSTVSNNGI